MCAQHIYADSYLIPNFLNSLEKESVLHYLQNETYVTKSPDKPSIIFMSEQHVDDQESFAYLRCPSISKVLLKQMTPVIKELGRKINQTFKLDDSSNNIAKLLRYTNGSSSLKSHADKIVDLKERSNIYMLRFGQPRTVVLTSKTTGEKKMVPVSPGDLFVLGWLTNMFWTHGIEKEETVTSTNYSIILRTSVTYLHRPTLRLWGPRTHFESVKEFESQKEKDEDDLLKKLWSYENKHPVSVEHYQELFTKK